MVDYNISYMYVDHLSQPKNQSVREELGIFSEIGIYATFCVVPVLRKILHFAKHLYKVSHSACLKEHYPQVSWGILLVAELLQLFFLVFFYFRKTGMH